MSRYEQQPPPGRRPVEAVTNDGHTPHLCECTWAWRKRYTEHYIKLLHGNCPVHRAVEGEYSTVVEG